MGVQIPEKNESLGQVGPGDYLTLSQQLIGSYDPRALLGYELWLGTNGFLDDGDGGPFQMAFDGKDRRWTNTATLTLTPGRDYRAFVRAVSFAGPGNASNLLHFKMAMPLPAPAPRLKRDPLAVLHTVILSVTSVSLKTAMLRWTVGNSTADVLPITHYIVQMAMEPTFDAWFDVPNAHADNTEYSLLITQLEPDFKYATRVLAASKNGVGLPSEPFYFWAGLLPWDGPQLVTRIASDEGTIRIQWDFPSGNLLGTGTRMENTKADWGVRGYMWDPKDQPTLVYDGFGNPDQVFFTVANATCGARYKIGMTLITMIGEGPMSAILDVTNARLPGVPRNVVVTNTTTSSVSLAWEEPEDTGCVPIHQYRILRYFGDQGFQVVGYAQAASGTLQIPAARDYVDHGTCFVPDGVIDDGSCNCPPSCLTTGNLYRFQVQACVLGTYGVETRELAEARTGRTFLFSSESVNEGHPDKICDQVSDAVLDACLTVDPKSKVACETATKDNMVMVAGEITTQAKLDYDKVVRGVVQQIGFDSFVDDLSSVDSKGLSHKTCEVFVRINKQSPDIAGGVHVGKEDLDVGAGDQGIMFGYASDETSDCMPLTHSMATRLGKTLTDVRKSGECWWLRPDGKTQVTIEYLQHPDGSVEPKKIHTVVISTQHAEPLKAVRSKECAGYKGAEMTAPSMEQMNKEIEEKVIKRTLESITLKSGKSAITLYGSHTHLHINPSGKFIIGGPQGDAGLTGRKIIIDTYGGWGAHGGGAFSGKDPTKVDRSAAYICRQMAKSVVNSGLSARCLVQLSYAIGVAKPLSLFVETYGSEKGDLTVNDITNVLKIEFDCRPGAIAQSLALREPKYQETAAYCHFGREPVTKAGIKFFEWENAKDLSKYKAMKSVEVEAALKSCNYLAKWVD
ncbi:unnamed protein product [Effrenium voratum]|uniref:S-adenosylmethionine synthase n=1 Tax=Effrenium voratum TaxID=2562239 RepID=A0AA36MQ50_9DINO|nr:unnamed protein product [Effrenium voratum]